MKRAEDYLIEEIEKLSELDQPWYEDYIYDGNSLAIINALKQAKIDAIEETCRVCAESAEADFEPLGWLAKQHQINPFIEGEDYEIPIIRSSILEVANKLKKELE